MPKPMTDEMIQHALAYSRYHTNPDRTLPFGEALALNRNQASEAYRNADALQKAEVVFAGFLYEFSGDDVQHVKALLAEAWEGGYASGNSNAMRYMSDEPDVAPTPNPYRPNEEAKNDD